jgi:hypothetical protein
MRFFFYHSEGDIYLTCFSGLLDCEIETLVVRKVRGNEADSADAKTYPKTSAKEYWKCSKIPR